MIRTCKELQEVYFSYLSSYVTLITSFARGIPQFSVLNATDQHLLIKAGILEVSFIEFIIIEPLGAPIKNNLLCVMISHILINVLISVNGYK